MCVGKAPRSLACFCHDAMMPSDVINAALISYELLKVSGKDRGLEALLQKISARFSRAAKALVPAVGQGKIS